MRSLLSAAAVSALLFASCKSDKTVDLKFNLQQGSKYRYTIDTKQDISQKVSGTDMKMQQVMTFQTTYDVKSTTGNEKQVAVTYDRIALKNNSPMMNMEWDSADPAKQNPALKSLGAMVGKSFTMTATDDGEIKSVSGVQAILAGAVDPSDPNAAMIQQQLSQTFNDSAMRQMMQQAMQMYPGKPVRPGDTWTKSMTMAAGPMAMKMDNTYKLESVSGNTAKVKVDTKITCTPGPAAAGMQGLSLNLKGTQSGTMDIDVPSGLMTDSKLTQKIDGSMSMQGMSIPMTMESTVTMKGEKL